MKGRMARARLHRSSVRQGALGVCGFEGFLQASSVVKMVSAEAKWKRGVKDGS